jgi:hypothetical protein
MTERIVTACNAYRLMLLTHNWVAMSWSVSPTLALARLESSQELGLDLWGVLAQDIGSVFGIA